MKKAVQSNINAIVESEYEKVMQSMDDFNGMEDRGYGVWKKLRSCQAWVAQFGEYYVLKSYNTIVAAIDIETDVLYDFLRFAYKYTATSSQHIAKFNHDYCARQFWGCDVVRTWKAV